MMKSILTATAIMFALSADATASLECTAGQELSGHVFERLTLAPGARVIRTDHVNKAGHLVLMEVGKIARVDGHTFKITGDIGMNKGLMCAGSCGVWSYELVLNDMPEPQENAVLTLSHEAFSEALGLPYKSVTSTSYACVFKDLEFLTGGR